MFAHGIQRGKDWRSPRRIRFESSDTTEWGSILTKLGKHTSESLEELEVLEVEADKLEGEVLIEPLEDIETKDDRELELKVDEPTDEKSADVWFGSARVHTSAGRYDEAEMAYRRGLAKYPSNGEAHLRLGTLLMRRDAFDIAEESLVEAVKYLPDSAEAWLQLGICLQSLEKWDESVDALKMATDLDPQNVEIWVKLGEADYYRSLYEEAARSFLRALRREPNNTYALFYLGRCMEYRGNNNHALRVYRKLLNINPVNPEILEELAKSFHRLSSMSDAQRAKSFASDHRRAISKKSA
jgi:tetratricopeptide (TPR) repeat protein